jgi:hypothetical protein
MNELVRLGFSAFNTSYISGAGIIPTVAIASCGIGLPIAATCTAPGARLPAIRAVVPPGLTG